MGFFSLQKRWLRQDITEASKIIHAWSKFFSLTPASQWHVKEGANALGTGLGAGGW